MYRGVSGKVYIFEAYCPHLGANLGIGGTVLGESIKCPFHGWNFNQDGICTHVPGLDGSSLPKAKLQVYDSLEINGFIYVWHHALGQGPDWYPDKLEEIEKMKLIHRGTLFNMIYSHYQEVVENSADNSHFALVHNDLSYYGQSEFGKFFSSVVHFEWRDRQPIVPGTTGPIRDFDSAFDIRLFGSKGPKIGSGSYFSRFFGVGIFHGLIKFDLFDYFEQFFYFSCGVYQHDEMKCEFVTQAYTKPGIMPLLFICLYSPFLYLITQDENIWTNKRFRMKPLFQKGEEKMVQYRRLAKQFYSE